MNKLQNKVQALVVVMIVGGLLIFGSLMIKSSSFSSSKVSATTVAQAAGPSDDQVLVRHDTGLKVPDELTSSVSVDDGPLVGVNVKRLPADYTLGQGTHRLQVRLATLAFNNTRSTEGTTPNTSLDLDISFTNLGSASILINPATISLHDGQGHVYAPVQTEDALTTNLLKAGNFSNSHLAFTLPSTATGLQLYYTNPTCDSTVLAFNLGR